MEVTNNSRLPHSAHSNPVRGKIVLRPRIGNVNNSSGIVFVTKPGEFSLAADMWVAGLQNPLMSLYTHSAFNEALPHLQPPMYSVL
ncbi:hypothetical protein GDO78_011464 [Eleutherodactylus coqui]|uniref:Uncharacterized protein n=1 Tax=Eleutherodactylus coqui TaxID=57060 RepID=A0A8J6F771_ELECQ|nr:hypothetical protein GDO78_011464 [Eleutherodactylus coqui]